jgi:hypothetical protein
MKKFHVTLVAILLLITFNSSAQGIDTTDFKKIDEFVLKLGKLDSMTMGTIARIITKPFTKKEEKARAIYCWIANNIDYDVKTARSNNGSKNTPTEVLQYRKAIGSGFASLFQDMCSAVDIRCLIPDGWVKTTAKQIGEPDDKNHTWAVVQLGTSPDTWYYVDPALASGTTDADMKVFTKSYSTAYFFTDKKAFNWQHFPDNEAWKLGEAPKNKNAFYDLPIIKTGAQEFGISKFTPAEGIIKTKTSVAVKFIIGLKNIDDVTKVDLIYGDQRKLKTKAADFAFTGSNVSFSAKFEVEGEYPLLIKVNGKEVMSYFVKAEE